MPETTSSKKVAILGFGVNNRALARYLLERGVALTIREKNAAIKDETAKEFAAFSSLISWEILPDITKNLEQFSLVFRTPSIPYHSAAIQKAKEKGVIISSQTNLFFERCPALIIGVTGTKGKGTTSSLIHSILSAGYKKGRVYLGGNIGVDPFSFLDVLTANDLVVLELSSFQLEDLQKSPHVAVLLHVTEEHLDHHKDVAEYRQAKAQLLAHQTAKDIAVLNRQYPEMQQFLPLVKGALYSYTRHTPARQSAWAEQLEGKEVVFTQIDNELESFEITGRKLRGDHNLENILPAVLVGSLYKVPSAVMQKVVKDFAGLPHRLSFVGSFNGVEFYDDSIATTPDSCLVALEAFSGRRIHLIAGGKDKGQQYGRLAPEIVQRCVSVSLLPGAKTDTLKKELIKACKKLGKDCRIFDPSADTVMESCLKNLQPQLQKGDVVLLAPTAASDAPYANYRERGDAFVAAIHAQYS